MSYTTHYENDGRGLVVSFQGEIVSDEVVTAVVEMYASDDIANLRYSVWDFSRVGRLDLTEEKLRAIGMMDKNAAQEIPHQKVVLIGTEDTFQGSDRRYAIYAEVWAGFEVEVFTNFEEARRWLAVRFPDLAPERIAPCPY